MEPSTVEKLVDAAFRRSDEQRVPTRREVGAVGLRILNEVRAQARETETPLTALLRWRGSVKGEGCILERVAAAFNVPSYIRFEDGPEPLTHAETVAIWHANDKGDWSFLETLLGLL